MPSVLSKILRGESNEASKFNFLLTMRQIVAEKAWDEFLHKFEIIDFLDLPFPPPNPPS